MAIAKLKRKVEQVTQASKVLTTTKRSASARPALATYGTATLRGKVMK